MGRIDLAVETGFKIGKDLVREMRIIPRKGAEITENPFVVQTIKDAGAYTKIVSFPEGSPMRNLGITDAQFTRLKNSRWADTGSPERIAFYRNPEGQVYSADGCVGWETGKRLFEGSLEKAKSFIEALRTMSENGVKLFGG